MINISLILLTLHFIADFVLQSDWMAINKSKNWGALALHCFVYSLTFAAFYGITFASITFLLHFVQDAITSRINSKLWQANRRHWFFVGIGADQLLHYALLAYTAKLLGV
jgi:hypothetical protein